MSDDAGLHNRALPIEGNCGAARPEPSETVREISDEARRIIEWLMNGRIANFSEPAPG